MSIGELHRFADGYEFYETLHGPMIWGACEICGTPSLFAEHWLRREPNDPPYLLCTNHYRQRWGLDPEDAGMTAWRKNRPWLRAVPGR